MSDEDRKVIYEKGDFRFVQGADPNTGNGVVELEWDTTGKKAWENLEEVGAQRYHDRYSQDSGHDPAVMDEALRAIFEITEIYGKGLYFYE